MPEKTPLFWFWLIWGAGIWFVILQAVVSHVDGYFTQREMRAHGMHNGYSFMEHGGMWADVFLVSPILAYILSQYRLRSVSVESALFAIIAVVACYYMGQMYKAAGAITPEAHAHDGRITYAGYIHGVYAVIAIWTILMFYFSPTSPHVSRKSLLAISGLLIPFLYLGVKKFNPDWKFESGAKFQVILGVIVIFFVTLIRLRYCE